MAEAHIIDGKTISAALKARVGEAVGKLKADHGLTPGLAVVLVGNDPASEVYVRNKGIASREAGMNSFEFRLPAEASEAEVLAKVRELNADPAVHGFLVQFPVPDQISQQAVIDAIDPDEGCRRASPAQCRHGLRADYPPWFRRRPRAASSWRSSRRAAISPASMRS